MRWSRRSQDESSHGVFCGQRTSAARGAALPSNAAAAGDSVAMLLWPVQRGPLGAARAAQRGEGSPAGLVAQSRGSYTREFWGAQLELGLEPRTWTWVFCRGRSLGEGQEPGRFLDCLRQSPFLLFLVTVDCAVSHSKKKYPGRTCVPPRESSYPPSPDIPLQLR